MKKKDNLILLVCLFMAFYLTSNILANKIINIYWFRVTASVISYPLTFLMGNLITEGYGKETTKRVINHTIICQILITCLTSLIVLIPNSSLDVSGEAFDVIFSSNIRIVLASVISFYVSQKVNIYLYDRFKKEYNIPYLSLIGSSTISLLVDILIFISISFIGIIDVYNLTIIFISQYLFQLITSTILISIFYIINKIKKRQI